MDPRSVVESTIFVLSLLTLLIQIAGWLWVRRLFRALKGGEGAELVGTISFLMAWMVVLRIAGMVIWIAYATLQTQAYDAVIGATLLSQTVFIVVVYVVWRRLRHFMGS